MPEINPARLIQDLKTLASFGRYKTGVHRPTYSKADMAARHWFAERLRDIGLRSEIDGIGNVYGFNDKKKRLALAGSHIESQNYAGWLDGALGVIFALEAARAISEDPRMNEAGLDLIGFADEEGHFGSFLGSRSFVGLVSESEIDSAKDRASGTSLRRALEGAGLAGRQRRILDPARYRAFFEAHIEQGDILENTGIKIGIVTAVVAIWNYRITVSGEQNHAGTTTMARRRDAGVGLVRLLAAIDRRFPKVAGSHSVWTTGQVTLFPGSKSVIPGQAEALFQFRDADVDVLRRLESELIDIVAEANGSGPCKVELVQTSASQPGMMNTDLQDVIDLAANRRAPEKHVRMPSGAGHDAQWLASQLPTAMLFVPSIGGISHHWTEDTAEEDIILGAQIFADAIAEVLMNDTAGTGSA